MTLRGIHLAADVAACILAASARPNSTRPSASSATDRDTSKVIAEASPWTTRRSASAVEKGDIPKKNVPKHTDPCERCKARGHTVNVCNHPTGYGPKEKHLLKPQQQPAPPGAKQRAPEGALRCEICGPDNVHEYTWICENCGGLVIDNGDNATKCPGCFAAKTKKTGNEQDQATAKSMLPKMKAASEQTYLRAAETGSAMALPQQSQEIVEKAAKLEEDIKNCERSVGQKLLQ